MARQIVPIGRARIVRPGGALTLVAWGNTVPLCERVAATLDLAGSAVEVIDLRWLSPWDRHTVLASARKTRRLLVVHEDNASAGFGAELIATVTESLLVPVQCRRVARPNTFVPCHYATQLEVLPSYRRVLEAAADLIGLDVTWEQKACTEQGSQVVPVLGSSPADRTVELVELAVRPGMAVKAGQLIASVEADKAVMELASPVDGVVTAVHLQLGDRVAVGAPLLTLAVGAIAQFMGQPEESEIARLAPRQLSPVLIPAEGARAKVMITGLAACRGRRRLSNTELLARLPALRAEDDAADGILVRTGIETRLVAESDQDVVSMAVEAAAAALFEAGIDAGDLALVICSTSTPRQIAPSTACQVMRALAAQAEVPAYDLSAACSGFLYALANAWDFLEEHPQAHVLVLTSETMRRIVDIDDPVSSPIFGDAATATVVSNVSGRGQPLAVVCRPVLGGAGDEGSALTVPLPGDRTFVRMDGKKVFSQVVRRMGAMLERACLQAQMSVVELSTIVPHQANSRIIEALRTRLNLPNTAVWDELREQGNTSSSSIPLALNTVLRRDDAGAHIGLCAFGAGFTFGGAILHRPANRRVAI